MPTFFSVILGFATVFVPQAGNPPTAVVQTPAAVQAPPLQAPAPTPAPGNPVVVVSTSLGDITLELYKDRAPVSVENFLQYVTEGFYEGTIFHRVKPGFAIQGGGFTDSMVEKTTRPPIMNEATNGLRNTRGTLAMARTRSLRSATSQFYINVVNNTALDHTGYSPADFGYAVFGRVLAGMDVVDKIAAVPTGTSGEHEDVPTTPVVIKKVSVKTPNSQLPTPKVLERPAR
jgi:peptidyl-prolyl cis-trans isomerase A (cyclophilin A)